MAKLGVSYEVHYRDEFGRFAAALDAAATRSVQETMEALEDDARSNAPVGPGRKPRPGRPKLRPSIRGRMVSSRSAVVGSPAMHSKPQEEGDGPHRIPNAFGRGPDYVVIHPGVSGTHYLRRALDRIMPKFMAILSKNYPG